MYSYIRYTENATGRWLGAIGYNQRAMLVRDIGEFGVIERLNSLVVRRGAGNQAVRGRPLLVDTGDDTAVWQSAKWARAVHHRHGG